MLMPSIFGENLFDDFFGDFPFYYDKDMKKPVIISAKNVMRERAAEAFMLVKM